MHEEGLPDTVCPLCLRVLADPYDKHHLVPRSKGGRKTVYMHRICHSKIHSVFTRSELANDYSSIENIKNHPEIKKFVSWISTKPPGFFSRTRKLK